MTFAAAYSEHPVAADATGEVLGRIAESGGTDPDLVFVFASGSHAEFLGEITSAVHSVIAPGVLVGAGAHGVIGERSESADAPAVSAWASWNGGVRPVRLDVGTDGEVGDTAVSGLLDEVAAGSTLLLIADPATFPAEAVIDEIGRWRPDLSVVGGLASHSGDGSALVLDDRGFTDGAVGVVIPPEQLVGPVVSPACRPVGDPMVVTAARGSYVIEIGGRPALERLEGMVADADAATRSLLAGGVQLGIALDGRGDHLTGGDFVVRSVLGADRARGVLAVAGQVDVGATVQFHARDAVGASEELQHRLDGIAGDAALVFTCTGRGRDLFGVDDHDASTVSDSVGTTAVGGMFCAGEFGPLGGRSRVHSFTASVLVFAGPDRR